MAAPLITVRALSTDGSNDPQRGQGQGNFLADKAAVDQIIRTRLLLFEGEWWENLTDGLPLWQKILTYGGANLPQVSLLIQKRITDTPYVTGVSNVQSSIDKSTRRLSFSCSVSTVFGPIPVITYPQPPSASLA